MTTRAYIGLILVNVVTVAGTVCVLKEEHSFDRSQLWQGVGDIQERQIQQKRQLQDLHSLLDNVDTRVRELAVMDEKLDELRTVSARISSELKDTRPVDMVVDDVARKIFEETITDLHTAITKRRAYPLGAYRKDPPTLPDMRD